MNEVEIFCLVCGCEISDWHENKYEHHCSNACKATSEGRHGCKIKLTRNEVYAHGEAAEYCFETEDGVFIIGNYEYANQVNYCPFCGKQAPKLLENTKETTV